MEKIQSGCELKTDFWNDLDQSLGNYILDYIHNNEDRVYMINAETEDELRLSELAKKGTNLAINLQTVKCTDGTAAAIYSENSTEFMIAFMGITLSGATVVTFSNMYSLDELYHAVSLTKPKVIFCSLVNFNKTKEAQKKYPFIEHVIVLNSHESPDQTTQIMENLTQDTNNQIIEPSYHPNKTAAILFSSGTSGLPKGVMLSHRNMLYTLKLFKEYKLFPFYGKYTVSTVPMFHIYGMFMNLATIVVDQTLIFLKRYEENLYMSLIERYKVQSLYLVPTLLVSFLKTDRLQDYDFSNVKYILTGAAPLKTAAEDEIKRRLNLKQVRQVYGMTESTLLLIIKREGNDKPGTCGTVIPGCQCKVVDTETNAILGPGQIGELCFKSPGIMKGYVNNYSETINTIKKGWLHTGDLGYYDNDGDFFIIDRLKELIKYKAYQVAPAVLEGVLANHPLVKEAGVIGIPDEEAGELPKAFVVKKSQAKITEKELQDYVANKVSPYEKLRGGITFVDEIPKNPSGKILRRKLRELITSCQY